MDLEEADDPEAPTNASPFMKGLLSHGKGLARKDEDMTNKMRTTNLDVAFRSTTDSLLDLFTELEDVISGPRLRELLEGAWNANPNITLKIIFNARSIHLGKSSRQTFYRCAGWLAKNHPQTLLANLVWLSRPVIQKKVEKKNGEDDFEMVSVKEEDDVDENDPARYDVKNGVSHGYWKDLLNLLVLHVNGNLDVLANPRDILNTEREFRKANWPKTKEDAHLIRREKRDARHEAAVKAFRNDPIYRALHLTVARLFAAQLKQDLALLHGDNAAAKRRISLCAKWAPSSERFHDKHTFVVSSIAEALHPATEFEGFESYHPENEEQRALYLRYAREAYRKDVSALRKQLELVERDLTANTFRNIKYDRVPSAAMNNYASLFAAKDMKRFGKYIENVASGKTRISGATLLPGALIKNLRDATWEANRLASLLPRNNNSNNKEDDDDDEEEEAEGDEDDDDPTTTKKTRGKKRKLMKGTAKALINAQIAEMKCKVLEGQWNTLVQRIKDSGTLSNAIAVADVSGSMGNPEFPDGTCPMDSAVGLALLIAEVTAPPFGGAFITFSQSPVVQRIDQTGPGRTLRHKVQAVERSHWGTNTDFVAVFERLLLPMAVQHKVAPADMVKRIFVFSDMQFDQAQKPTPWVGGGPAAAARNPPTMASSSTDEVPTLAGSYERIQAKYREAGYEMPELVFWNLAGGREGWVPPGFPARPSDGGDVVAPKPVVAREKGTALVSGYSQGMLKVFLEGGTFEEGWEEEEEEEEEIVERAGEEEEEEIVVVEKVKKKQKMDPLSVMSKAVDHRAYGMLRVVD